MSLEAFTALGLQEPLANMLLSAQIEQPTSVQTAAVPALLAGRDATIVSPTGTGKTLAYLLPILQRIDGTRRETQAVILSPTQELAMQIVREAEKYGEPLGIRTVALIGGAALSRQLDRMKTKPALVVGTPGRVKEVASLKKLSLPSVRTVVVDETDRIFSLGGRGDVEQIIRGCSRDRQTAFVSATRSEAMQDAERRWLRDPIVVSVVEEQGTKSGLPSTIRHWFTVCDRRDKIDFVRRLVLNLKPSAALIFVNDIERIGELSSKLRYEGFAVDTLYGDTAGRDRGEALRRFRSGRTKLLIATDLAARGLDVPGLPLVIQFEPALDGDHYVHRAGRTGRMGRDGTSLTLVTPQERFVIDKLSKQLGIEMEAKALYQGKLMAPEAAGQRRNTVQERAADTAEKQRPAAAGAKARDAAGSGVRAGAKPGGQPAGANLGGKPGAKPGAKPQKAAARTAPAKPAKVKADRERDRKNKGAPKWLKEKRSVSSEPPKP